MKKLILVFFLILIVLKSNSQQVISSAGDNFTNSTLSISWTIGEPVTKTVSNSSNILTQGFHQSKLNITEIYNINSEEVSISLFPNPTQDFVNLKVEDYENLSFQLFSFNGKLIQTNKIFSKKTEIKMNNLSASAYFLKILKGNKLIKTYQIVKQ